MIWDGSICRACDALGTAFGFDSRRWKESMTARNNEHNVVLNAIGLENI